MARAPYQVLVIPFRKSKTQIFFCLLKRSDAGYWQFVAGGGEDKEAPEQAAIREATEELGLKISNVMKLENISSLENLAKRNLCSAGAQLCRRYFRTKSKVVR